VAFSPDCMSLASGSENGTVRLWDVPSRQPLGPPLSGHSGEVKSVAFHPDGQILVSGGSDATVGLWNTDFDSWKSEACRFANRNLTCEEWEQFLGEHEDFQVTCPELPVPALPCDG
jgi:WD40 repeat protein